MCDNCIYQIEGYCNGKSICEEYKDCYIYPNIRINSISSGTFNNYTISNQNGTYTISTSINPMEPK
jgi:hypothetical protein